MKQVQDSDSADGDKHTIRPAAGGLSQFHRCWHGPKCSIPDLAAAARGALGLVELALVDEVDGGVGQVPELVGGVIGCRCGGEPIGDFRGDVGGVPGRRCNCGGLSGISCAGGA